MGGQAKGDFDLGQANGHRESTGICDGRGGQAAESARGHFWECEL